jgi:undecaprenyl-diphosphatase
MTPVVVPLAAQLTLAKGVFLGLIEGITEFLPISSTGHLTVAARLLDLHSAAVDSYIVVVQLGAIAAVLVLYRSRIASLLAAARHPQRGDGAHGLLVALAVAFAPAAAVGAVLGDRIKEHLFGVGPVAAAWAVGGLAILVFARRRISGERPIELVTVRDGALIGIAQVAALWPGTSRSLVTILAAVAIGLTLPAAVEFSFLLGLATLGAATAYELLKDGPDIVDAFGFGVPIAGMVVAFVAAVLSIRWMVGYLQSRSLAAFGAYRLGAAAVAALLLLTNAV